MKKSIFIMVVFGTLAVLAFAFAFMSLWNWLVPELFNGPELTFLQAAGVLLLAKLATGTGGGCWKNKCKNCGGKEEKWRGKMERWKMKCSSMSPEQKEKLKKCFDDKFEEKVEENKDKPE